MMSLSADWQLIIKVRTEVKGHGGQKCLIAYILNNY